MKELSFGFGFCRNLSSLALKGFVGRELGFLTSLQELYDLYQYALLLVVLGL